MYDEEHIASELIMNYSYRENRKDINTLVLLQKLIVVMFNSRITKPWLRNGIQLE